MIKNLLYLVQLQIIDTILSKSTNYRYIEYIKYIIATWAFLLILSLKASEILKDPLEINDLKLSKNSIALESPVSLIVPNTPQIRKTRCARPVRLLLASDRLPQIR